MNLIRYSNSLLSPEGRNSRLSVLIFHRIHRITDPLFPGDLTTTQFDNLLYRLKKWFNVISLHDALSRLPEGRMPARPLCISFDDGYADNHEFALPILRKHGLAATFFVATGFLDGGCMFNDKIIESIRGCEADILDLSTLGLGVFPMSSMENKRCAIDTLLGVVKYIPSPEREQTADSICTLAGVSLPLNLMMSRNEVREMHREGMEIGGHTRNHPILARTESGKALHELVDGKADLDEITGSAVRLFAYPNGKPGVDYLAEHVAMVKEVGFLGAVSTAKGVSSCGSDVFQIPRFTPWDRDVLKFGIRLASNLRTRTYDTV